MLSLSIFFASINIFIHTVVICDEFVIHIVDSIDLRYKQTHQGHSRIEDESQTQQCCLVVSIEGHYVSGEKSQPNKQSGGHWDEDIPGLVEVVWQFTSQEAKDSAENDEEQIEGEWDDQTFKLKVTQKLNILCR